MRDSDLTKLRRKRARIHERLRALEPQVADYRAKLAEIEAAILAISPELDLPRRFIRRNPFFKFGELPRLAITIMREANRPVTVRYICARALAIKGCPLPTPGVMRQTRKRVSQTLTEWNRRGLTVKLGSWNQSRHQMARY